MPNKKNITPYTQTDIVTYCRRRLIKEWKQSKLNDAQFCKAYNRRELELPVKIYTNIKSISSGTLYRWGKKLLDDSIAPTYGNRKNKSILQVAEDGKVLNAIIACITNNPYLSVPNIRQDIEARFGDELEAGGKLVKLPSLKSFERLVKKLKSENKNILLAIQNPDKHKGTIKPSFGVAGTDATYPNERWEIDASPTDIMTYDGRLNLYCLIDVYTRRIKTLITRTPHCAAALKLIRDAITDWGIPDIITTDNGADFIANNMDITLRQLGIFHDVAPPYSPEKKPFVERVIGTINHGFMPTQPGYVGHDVKTRQQIRERKAFAERLGETDAAAFKIELSGYDLTERLEAWVAGHYHQKPHGSLAGKTPNQVAAEWNGEVRMLGDDRLLKMLFAPIGSTPRRMVTKQGIKYDRNSYGTPEMVPFIGREVIVRHDPDDAGIIYLINPDNHQFIGEAICPEIRGTSRETLAKQIAKASQDYTRQGKVRLRKIVAEVHAEGSTDEVLNEMWKNKAGLTEEVKHQTQSFTPPAAPDNQNVTHVDFDAKDKRIARGIDIETRLLAGEDITDEEQRFISGYRNTAEYAVSVATQLTPNQTGKEQRS